MGEGARGVGLPVVEARAAASTADRDFASWSEQVWQNTRSLQLEQPSGDGTIAAPVPGLAPAPAPEPATPATLIALGSEYRVGLQNFYVVTRYNRSPLYAAAVCDLADAFARRLQGAGK